MTKKQLIIETAVSLFARQGYGNTATSEIAKEAGVAEGTIFHHFKSKHGLLIEIMQDTFSVFFKDMREISFEQGSAEDNFNEIVAIVFKNIKEYPERFRLLLREFPGKDSENMDEFFAVVKDRTDIVEETIRKILEKGIEEGEFVDVPVEETAYLIRGTFFGIIKMHFIFDRDVSKMPEVVTDFCLRSLRRRQ